MNRKLSALVLGRSRAKSALLSTLIMLVTLFCITGVSLYHNSQQLLKQADEQYTTLAVLEYTAGGYPDETNMNQDTLNKLTAIDEACFKNQDLVKEYLTQTQLMSYVEGSKISSFALKAPYSNCAVIVFKVMYASSDGNYRCTLVDDLYSPNVSVGASFGLSKDVIRGQKEYKLQADHTYIACGDFRKESNLTVFSVMPKTGVNETIDPSKKIKSFPFTDITDNPDYLTSSAEMEYWNKLAEFYRVMNGSFPTVAVDSMEKQTGFYVGVSNVLEGRIFSDKEANEGKKVCMIHEGIAAITGAKVGDHINLKLHCTEDQTKFYESYNPEKGFLDEGNYEIVGIYTSIQNSNSKNIYIPKKSVNQLPKEQKHYAFANVVIENGKAKEYEELTKKAMIDHLRIDFFDQGYTQTVAPIYAMRTNSIFIMFLSFVCVSIVLLLFATIHITKQREFVAIMTALGTGRKLIHQYLSTGTYILAGAGCLAGGVLGYIFSSIVSKKIYLNSVERYAVDLRYSNLAMGIQKTFHGQFDRSIGLPLLLSLVTFLITTVICRITAAKMIEETYCFGGNKPKKKRKKKEKTQDLSKIKTFHVSDKEVVVTPKSFRKLNRGQFIFRHSIHSIFRNRSVSLLMLLIPFGSAVFMILFSDVINHFEISKQEAYDTIPINAYFASPYGKYINCTEIDSQCIEAVENSLNVDNSYKSNSKRYVYVGKISESLDEETKHEVEQDLLSQEREMMEMPKTSFALESRVAQLFGCPSLVQTEKLERAREFFGAMPPKVTIDKEYQDFFLYRNDEYLKKPLNGNMPVLVNEQFLKEKELEIGDSILVSLIDIYWENDKNAECYENVPALYRIVGTFKSTTGKDNIYAPLDKEGLNKADYMNFSLVHTDHLEFLRNELAELDISSVGYVENGRLSFVIEDRVLVQTIENINNNIMFMTLLRYILFGLIVIIGFVSSYLSMRTRQREVAMIRSMGTGRLRTFYMFFHEQSVITLVGIVLGAVIAFAYIGMASITMILMMVGLYLCYMVGSGLCIMRMNQTNILETLSVAE